MNYYDHHIGDYDADTAHLTWLEDMAYTRLMRLYYRKEAPIPGDIAQACRLVRATSKEERAAVETVLREFFALMEDGWHQSRCDGEIAAYQARVAHNREVGKRGGRPRKAQAPKEPDGNQPGLTKEPAENPLGYFREPETNPPQSPFPIPQTPNTGNGQASYDNPHAPDGRKARCRALERRQFQRIVGLVAVAAFGAGPVCFGDAGFHGQDGLGIGFCLRPAGQLQHLADIGLVALALRGEVFAQVHFAVTQAQP